MGRNFFKMGQISQQRIRNMHEYVCSQGSVNGLFHTSVLSQLANQFKSRAAVTGSDSNTSTVCGHVSKYSVVMDVIDAKTRRVLQEPVRS